MKTSYGIDVQVDAENECTDADTHTDKHNSRAGRAREKTLFF